MNKENFVATMLAIYAILLTLCLALYAFIDFFNIDKSLASNLLVWSATIFGPLVLLLTFNSWRQQKVSEVLSDESKVFYSYIHDNFQDLTQLIKLVEENGIGDHYYHSIKNRYSLNLQFLNLYADLLKHINDLKLKSDVDAYIKKLKDVFGEKYDFEVDDLLNKLKAIKDLSTTIQHDVMEYILLKK